MAVEVILALLWEELDRADVTVAGLQRLANGEIVRLAVEGRGLTAELAGRMRVRVRREPVAI